MRQIEEKLVAIKKYQDLINYLLEHVKKHPHALNELNFGYRDIHGTSGNRYTQEDFLIYYIADIFYSKYLLEWGRIDMLNFKWLQKVIIEYKIAKIDIEKDDDQVGKYKLITLNTHMEIFNGKECQTIKDKRINKYFWIKVPKELLKFIEDFLKKGLISKISFRIDYISECVPCMEEKEFGLPMHISVSSLPSISKFYSTDAYENSLWITHDKEKKSLTFEELVKDFEIIEVEEGSEESIVTQVVHLEYSSEAEMFFVTHLDHEFVIYNLENYQKRSLNATIKGHRKVKTFKIDNSKIPFYTSNPNDSILIQTLNAYFKNYNLINEYFSNIK